MKTGTRKKYTYKEGYVPPQHKRGYTTEIANLYPEIEGYGRTLKRSGGTSHVGYTTDRMEPCRCGARPVLEQYVSDVDEHGNLAIPSKDFVAICPHCELKAIGHGSLEQCVDRWNAHRYSYDAVMVRRKLRDPDMRGCETLSNKVIAYAVDEAVVFIKRKHALQELLDGRIDDMTREITYGELKRVRSNLYKIQQFLRDSPLVFTHDEDAILSGIRRSVYPDLTPAERVQIPLDLTRM